MKWKSHVAFPNSNVYNFILGGIREYSITKFQVGITKYYFGKRGMWKYTTFTSRHIKYEGAVATMSTLYNVASNFVFRVK